MCLVIDLYMKGCVYTAPPQIHTCLHTYIHRESLNITVEGYILCVFVCVCVYIYIYIYIRVCKYCSSSAQMSFSEAAEKHMCGFVLLQCPDEFFRGCRETHVWFCACMYLLIHSQTYLFPWVIRYSYTYVWYTCIYI